MRVKDLMSDFITIPNIISLFRIYSTIPIVFFIWIGDKYYLVSLVLIIIAYLSDAIDGMLARALGQVSEWGKILDPLGDKILSTALVITFAQIGILSIWFAIIVVIRDLLISLFSTKMIKNYRFIQQSVLIGKVVTLLLAIFYSLSMLKLMGFISVGILKKLEIPLLTFIIISGMYYLSLYTKNNNYQQSKEKANEK